MLAVQSPYCPYPKGCAAIRHRDMGDVTAVDTHRFSVGAFIHNEPMMYDWCPMMVEQPEVFVSSLRRALIVEK